VTEVTTDGGGFAVTDGSVAARARSEARDPEEVGKPEYVKKAS